MKLHDAAFYAATFFIVGAALPAVFPTALSAILSAILLCLFVGAVGVMSREWFLCALSLVIVAGSLYYISYNKVRLVSVFESGREAVISGIVEKAEERGLRQDIKVGTVVARAPVFPKFEYGDLVEIRGVVDLPEKEYVGSYRKQGVYGLVSKPEVILIEKNKGNFLKAGLLKINRAARETFGKILPPDESKLLGGLTLGSKENFDKNFREKLSRSGTSHIVALSGYNIMVIAEGLAALLAGLFSRRATFIISSAAIFLFVVMTGAEASVVRAALMGGILLLADYAERQYSFRNTIAIAAALMLFQNPNVLAFDIGFQLSFCALLGIVYLRPILSKYLRIGSGGFMNWRDNLATTLSAQLAVLPILILQFGSFSASGLVSNLLILSLVPATMFLGFITATLGFFSITLARAIGYIVHIFLSTELKIIDFFSGFGYVSGLELGYGFAVVYYIVMISSVVILWKKVYEKN